MKELLMGNEAIALGALAAGVCVVSGYPGTPSSEVLETVAKRNPGHVYVEWSVNEKIGVEVAAGAAYAGARSMVTMKQVGLNVASDPIMCVNYIGIKGGMVIYVADDPGPISSQTEQDTRHFGSYAHIPVFDCDSPEQAFHAVQDAFEFSEKHGTPVILRSTTRVCHSCADIDVPKINSPLQPEGFKKDDKWVIFPKLAYKNKLRIAGRESLLADEFSEYSGNTIEGNGSIGILCGGISHAYVMEAIIGHEQEFTVFKVATPYPFPSKLALDFMKKVNKIFVFEELDPYLEDALIYLRGSKALGTQDFIRGKRTGTVPVAGELSATIIGDILESETGINTTIPYEIYDDAPAIAVRPPVLCAGCPHRGAFYAVKKAVGKGKAIFCGDIGCYTLGNAPPLDMVDTCLCMGAGVTIAQGLNHVDSETVNFAFIGDSTFFASGITGVVNALYNQSNMILVVLDNSTTAMTGHQPHPGMGITMMGKRNQPMDIQKILEGIGVKYVRVANPLDFTSSVEVVKSAMAESGVRAIIFKSPCAAIIKSPPRCIVHDEKCTGCMHCINQLGCPALITKDGKAFIDGNLCCGCKLCAQICPAGCIGGEKK